MKLFLAFLILYRLIHIIPYKHLFPPFGGGALRCFHVLSELARFNEIHLIIHQAEGRLKDHINGYKFPDSVIIYSTEDSPPPPTFFDKLPKRIGPGLHYRCLRRDWRGPADSTLLKSYHLLQKIIRTHHIDCVVFEHLSSMKMAGLIRRWQPKIRCILDAHNVDHRLAVQTYRAINKDNGLSSCQIRALKKLQRAESRLAKHVNSFWACSDDDRMYLEFLNSIRGYTIPNGVDTGDYFFFDLNEKKNELPFLIFSASFSTTANLDGLNYLVDEIWPFILDKHPQLRLLLVGNGITPAQKDKLRTIPSVEIIGKVPDVRPYYQKASISIVPLRIGSGTRLKILESMSQGNPVVSTTKGAEGINAVDGHHILIADSPAEFTQFVTRLISNQVLFNRIRHYARVFVEKNFDWKIIGNLINRALVEVITTKR